AMGYSRIVSRGRQPYATRDGYITLLPYNDKQWREVLRLFGREELASDPRFATQAARSRHAESVYAFIAGQLGRRGTDEWLALLRDTDIPHARITSIEHLRQAPPLAAVGLFEPLRPPHAPALVR